MLGVLFESFFIFERECVLQFLCRPVSSVLISISTSVSVFRRRRRRRHRLVRAPFVTFLH